MCQVYKCPLGFSSCSVAQRTVATSAGRVVAFTAGEVLRSSHRQAAANLWSSGDTKASLQSQFCSILAFFASQCLSCIAVFRLFNCRLQEESPPPLHLSSGSPWSVDPTSSPRLQHSPGVRRSLFCPFLLGFSEVSIWGEYILSISKYYLHFTFIYRYIFYQI